MTAYLQCQDEVFLRSLVYTFMFVFLQQTFILYKYMFASLQQTYLHCKSLDAVYVHMYDL